MKPLLLAVLLLLFSTGLLRAQSTFTVQHDTVYAAPAVGTGATVLDCISAVTDTVKIAWKVIASDFPEDWILYNAICDNRACYFLTDLWSPTTGTLSTDTSKGYGVAHLDTPGGDFHMLIGFSDTSTGGCHYLTVRMSNIFVPSDTTTETYIICNYPLSSPTILRSGEDVVLYPNPAFDKINLISTKKLSSVVICNSAGRACFATRSCYQNMTIDINNLQPGIYFVSTVDIYGATITTKFTKQ